MNLNLRYILPSIILIGLAACINKNKINTSKNDNTTVFPKGEKITNDNFTGTAYLQMLIAADSLNATAVGNVTFEPGARTKWHLHPGGQILLVMDGVGYYQEKGQPKKTLRKGDVIKCPPNIPHWHGASADTAFIQIAITNNNKGATVWMDEVIETIYNNSNE
jgi:quercetin dioxygenase-like cupin family protein